MNHILKLIRAYHNVKQTELADAFGISKSYLSEIESGKKTPSLDLLEQYSKYFELPLSSIMMFYENYDKRSKTVARDFVVTKATKLLDWIADAKIS